MTQSTVTSMSPPAIALALQVYLDEVLAARTPWSWSNNCCHFAARWVRRATGVDCLGALADVADARAARRVLAEIGAATLRDAVTLRMAREPMAALCAQVGDVVLLRHPPAAERTAVLMGAALGICAGRTVVCMDPSGGLARLTVACASDAWPLAPRHPMALALPRAA